MVQYLNQGRRYEDDITFRGKKRGNQLSIFGDFESLVSGCILRLTSSYNTVSKYPPNP